MPKDTLRYSSMDDPIELFDDDDDVFDIIDSDMSDSESNREIKRKRKSPKKSKGRLAPEFEIQKEFTTYIQTQYPDVLATSSIAGVYLPKRTAGRCKDSGLVSGFPDYMVFAQRYDPTTRRFYGVLFIEFKAPGRKVIRGSAQEEKLDSLDRAGYCVRVINNIDNAIQTLDWYLSLPKVPYNTMISIQDPMTFRHRHPNVSRVNAKNKEKQLF